MVEEYTEDVVGLDQVTADVADVRGELLGEGGAPPS